MALGISQIHLRLWFSSFKLIFTWHTTNIESLRKIKFVIFIFRANFKPLIKASYLTSLLVAFQEKYMALISWCPSRLSNNIPTPTSSLLTFPSIFYVHPKSGIFSIFECSSLSGSTITKAFCPSKSLRENFSIKSASACPWFVIQIKLFWFNSIF